MFTLLFLPMLLDCIPVWLGRRLTFALAGRERGDDDARFDGIELPSSGWAGSLLVLFVWLVILLAALFAVALILVRPPSA